MKQEAVQLLNKGMRQDESISKSSVEYAFENHNIRLVQSNDNTYLSITNEQNPEAALLWKQESATAQKGYYIEAVEVNNPVDPDILEWKLRVTDPETQQIIWVNNIGWVGNIPLTIEYWIDPERENELSFIRQHLFTWALTEEELQVINTEVTVNGQLYYTKVTLPPDLYTEFLSSEPQEGQPEPTPLGKFLYCSNTVKLEHEELYLPTPTEQTAMRGRLLGVNESSKYCTLFTVEHIIGGNLNHIYRLEYGDHLSDEVISPGINVFELYAGDLNITNKVETLFYYENENVQKVYWVDGINSPRFINIANNLGYIGEPSSIFDFSPAINTIPTVTITKDYSYSGLFAQGVIQYFISYYNKFFAETKLVYASSLQYLSFKDRGAKEDENVYCGFKIDLRNLDTNFEYARIYSVQRTSQDGPVIAKIVTDIAIQQDGTASFVDLGTSGEVIDPNLLYYIGGQDLIAGTLDSKDDVLFLGDITLKNAFADSSIETLLRDRIEYVTDTTEQHAEDIRRCMDIYWGYKSIPTPTPRGYYAYEQEINKSEKDIAGFKRGEIYRFAIQFMTPTGAWTTPIWIGDSECTLAPKYDEDTNSYMVPCPAWDLTRDSNATETIINLITSKEYKAARLLYAHTDYTTRKILAQGVINPTLFNYYERVNNSPYSVASWNFRPRNGGACWQHYENIGTQFDEASELQGVNTAYLPMFYEEAKAAYDHFKYFNAYLGVDPGHQLEVTLVYYTLPENNPTNLDEIIHGNRKLLQFDYASSSTPGYFDDEGYFVIAQRSTNTGNWNDTRNKMWDKVKTMHNSLINAIYNNDPVTTAPFLDRPPFDKDVFLPSKKLIKKVMRWAFSRETWMAIAGIIITLAGVAAGIVSCGTTVAGAAAAITVLSIALESIAAGAFNLCTLSLALGILGSATVAAAAIKGKKDALKPAAREMAKLGWFNLGNIDDQNNGLKDFLDLRNPPKPLIRPFNGGTFWVCGGRTSALEYSQITTDNKTHQYYVDNSIVTLNTPEMDAVNDVINNNQSVELQIVGTAPVEANYSDYTIEASGIYSERSSVIKYKNSANLEYKSTTVTGLVNDYLYQDDVLSDAGSDVSEYTVGGTSGVVGYKTFLWNRPFLSLNGDHEAVVKNSNGTTDCNNLIHKIFASQKYSSRTNYFVDKEYFWSPVFGIGYPKVYYDDKNTFMLDTGDTDSMFYSGTYDTLVPIPAEDKYPILTDSNVTVLYDPLENPVKLAAEKPYSYDKMLCGDAVRIKFESTPHIVLPFLTKNFITPILPKREAEEPYSISSVYNIDRLNWESFTQGGGKTYKTPWGITGSTGTSTPGVLLWIVPDDHLGYIGSDPELLSIDCTSQDYVDFCTTKWGGYRDPWSCFTIETSTVSDIENIIYVMNTWAIDNYFGEYVAHVAYEKYLYTIYTEADVENAIFGVGGWLSQTSLIVNLKLPASGLNPAIDICCTLNSGYDAGNNSEFFFGYCPVQVKDGAEWSGILGQIFTDAGLWVTGSVLSLDSQYVVYNRDNVDGPGSVALIQGDMAYVENEIPEEAEIADTNGGGSYMYVGELYKKNFQYSTLYGGYSDYAIQRIQWVPCSEPNYNLITVDNTWGDTFYQRWDCLKSYPSTEEDQNSIVEILSFMVESHINLDGRCDINRGLSNIINARPTNWNLMNKVYSQENNLFQYAVLDDKFKTNRFSNEIIWSLNKKSVSDIDTWSNITALSSLFLDGQYGPVNKILNNNGSLLTFQDKAIAVVNFNNRTQLSTEQGVPIEVANSGKVNGYTYVDTTSGAKNKWTICKTRNGIYYADSYNKQFRVFNGEGAKDLGLDKGMSNFFKQAIDVEYNNYTTYDISTGDVYFKDYGDKPTIAYNESIGSFTSFYSMYDDILFYNLSGHEVGFSINDFIVEAIYPRQDQHWGNFYMIYKVNPEPLVDKIFSTIEYVGDVYSTNYSDYPPNSGYLEDVPPINGIDVYNEYQDTGFVQVTEDPDLSDISKRKFRIRRIQIPRDVLDANAYGLNRIRNPWCMVYLQGGDEDNENLRVQLHSIVVKYFK